MKMWSVNWIFFQIASKYHQYGVQGSTTENIRGKKAGRISDPNTKALKQPKGKPDLTWTYYIWKHWNCCNTLENIQLQGRPRTNLLKKQQKTVFDRKNSLPINKASNPVQEREERRARTTVGFGELNPGSLGVWKEKKKTKQERGGIV